MTQASVFRGIRLDPFEHEFVSIDLETTGLNANSDTIIELGAVRFRGDQILDRYQTFVNPGRRIPPFIQQLTSITPAQIERAPTFNQVADQFADFIGDAPIVGHNVAFDIGFLRSHHLPLANPNYNTWDLASIFLPTLPEYNLSALATRLGLDHSQAHRASADAEITAHVFHRLLKIGSDHPATKVAFIARAARAANAPVADLLEGLIPHAPGANATLSGSAAGSASGVRLDHLADQASADSNDGPPTKVISRPFTEQQIESLLDPDGIFAKSFPNFETRPEQAEMLKAVTRAIYQGRKLIVEGGTGIGKSIAYLLPAVMYAATNGQRVVVSTNTINLQEQLMEKDIPEVRRILEEAGILELGAFRAAQLKGRSNYVCLHRWNNLGTSDSINEDEARVIGKTAVWLDETQTGDRTNLNLNLQDWTAWSRICADAVEGCPAFRGGAPCFLRQARDQAESAHILVINHALLLADLAVGGTVLQDYQRLIIDEAHHLEEEASRQMGFEIGANTLTQELEAVYRIISHLNAAAARLGETLEAPRARESVAAATAACNQVGQAWQRLWETLEELYRNATRPSDSGRPDNDRQPLTLDQGLRQSRPWSAASIEWESVSAFMHECVNTLTALQRAVVDGLFYLSDDGPAAELASAAEILTEIDSNLASIFGRYEEDRIQWLDYVRRNLTLHSTPLDVGPILADRLFAAKESVVLTSATLATDSRFDFLRNRVGFPEDCDELLVDSPFNYRRNTLLLVPDDLPDPRRGADHANGTAEVILNMARSLDGHILALFTSHSALRDASFRVRGRLRAEGISVLAQGIDGTPRQLIDRLQSDPRSVLLGTASFWEGVDLESGVLRGLLVCRLPFPVPNDPVVKARGNLYNNPFNEYQVPNAVLRFRQGFGRLIRSKTDRGAVVILDRRIQTANYGDRFLNALPPCTIQASNVSSVGRQAAQWLGLSRSA
jgi:DNA polymerase-3 subunit epsilon/ATP-dependent DNA helicase DinG